MPWAIVGQVGVPGLCVIAVLFGFLIPRWSYKEIVGLWKQRSEDYKAAWEAEKAINATNTETLKMLLVLAKRAENTQSAVLAAVPTRAGDVL